MYLLNYFIFEYPMFQGTNSQVDSGAPGCMEEPFRNRCVGLLTPFASLSRRPDQALPADSELRKSPLGSAESFAKHLKVGDHGYFLKAIAIVP